MNSLKGCVSHVRHNSFGFIRVEGRAADIFFHKNGVIRDKIGRLSLPPGTVVSFEMATRNGRSVAVNVKNLDPLLDQIDPETYVEIGTICEWNRRQRSGLLMRPNGDSISLDGDDIVTEGEDQIRQGTLAQYRVASYKPRWKAVDVSLFQDS